MTTSTDERIRPRHRGMARRCTKCGKAEDEHGIRHAFRHPTYEKGPAVGHRRAERAWFR